MLSEREAAFVALHKGSYLHIYRYILRRINDTEMAQELAADVFRVAWQKWETTKGPDVPWLYSVARNLVGNAYRSRERHQALQLRLQSAAFRAAESPSGIASVDAALDALRPQDREILQLAYWDGLGTADIAKVLGCSPAAARVRLHRAREAFRKAHTRGNEFVEQKTGA